MQRLDSYTIKIFSIKQSSTFMEATAPATTHALKLYLYGSCESDQYYHPSQLTQSKRPICLTDLPTFTIIDDEEDKEDQAKSTIIPNPLYKQQIVKVTCGGLHTLVMARQGIVWSFGCNDEGALGRQGLERIPGLVKLQQPVDLFAAGDNHSIFANSESGNVYFTGSYKYLRGQAISTSIKLPIKFNISSIDARCKNQPITKLQSGANHTVLLISKRLFCRGEPQAFTTGRRINQRHKISNSLTFDGVGLTQVEDVWCGGYHSVAKIKKGDSWKYYAWGTNTRGQLGIGSFVSQAFPVEIQKLRGKNIIQVTGGTNFTLFLSQQGEVYGCGQNEYGQMGLGQNYKYVDSQEEGQDPKEAANQLLQSLKQHLNIADAPKNKPQSKQEKQPENNQKQHGNEIKEEKNGIKDDKMQDVQPVQLKNQIADEKVEQNNKNDQIDEEQIQNHDEAISPNNQRNQQNNLYIKTIKKIQFPTPVNAIASGSEFCFAWNPAQLYTWGMAMNFVLLNGNEDEDQYTPFKVNPKIINNEEIVAIGAGGQHVAYLAKAKGDNIQTAMKENVKKAGMEIKGKLSRKKKV